MAQTHVWPAEGRWISADFVYDGTLLACAEMLRGGICFNDMYFFPRDAYRAVRVAKMRATLGMVVIQAETAYAKTIEEYLDQGLSLRDELADDDHVKTAWAPHSPYTVSDGTFEKIVTYARLRQ